MTKRSTAPSRALMAAIALIGFSAGGANAASPPSKAVQAVIECRKQADNAARLACYDAAASQVAQDLDSGDLVAIDRQQRRVLRRETFGLTLPSFDIFDHGEKLSDVDRMTDAVTGAGPGPDGKWVIRLESGAVWRAIENVDFYPDPKPGDPVVIFRAALGSFKMKVAGQPAIRVHRDQ